MISEEHFHTLVGVTIKYCQCIENDIKLIYAGMLEGDFDQNLEEIRLETMGSTIKKLQDLDRSDGSPYFSGKDYRLLKDTASIRNYWAHQGYLDYVYDPQNKFPAQYAKLQTDCQKLENLHKITQNVRLAFFGFPPEN